MLIGPRSEKEKSNDLWWAEIERYGPSEDDYDAANCAELAEELDLFRIQADADPDFESSFYEWDVFIFQNSLWLPLEQCCNDGVLLPMGMRTLRVKTCPEELLRPLGRFFEVSPAHVKHYVALIYYVTVRSERARRTGSPEWRPKTATPRSPLEGTVFFRPPKLTVRKYTD